MHIAPYSNRPLRLYKAYMTTVPWNNLTTYTHALQLLCIYYGDTHSLNWATPRFVMWEQLESTPPTDAKLARVNAYIIIIFAV